LSAHARFYSVERPRTACGEATPFVIRIALEVPNHSSQYDCLEVLTGDEAQTVLNELLSSRPDLISDARRAANALLATVSFADVAADVFGALQALDLDDLDAGPRPGGYIEPSEAAWNAIEKVVTPYFHDLERRVKLRHEDEALDVCEGIVLGPRGASRLRTARICRGQPIGTCRPRSGDLPSPTPRVDIPAQPRREAHAQLGMARSLTKTASARFRAPDIDCDWRVPT
jgi:hypothetical protein